MAAQTTTAPKATSPLANGDGRIRFAIAGGPQAPERARAWIESRVPWLPEHARTPVLLLSSELVNNAVRHGGAGKDELIGVALWPTSDGVAVEVSDAGPGFTPHDRDEPLDEPGGWGLVLVERMAARWGVVRDSRTRVWFELAA